MPNKFELQEYLGVDENTLNSYLEACQLSIEWEHYSDEQRDLIEQYRDAIVKEELFESYQELINQSKSPCEAINQLAQEINSSLDTDPEFPNDSEEQVKKPRKSKKKLLAIFDLLKEGTKKTKKPMTLSKATELLEVCGLPEKPEYSTEEADRFLEACDLVVNQGMSLAEVVKKFNTTSSKNNLFSSATGIAQPSTQKALAQIAQTGNQLSYQMVQAYQQAWVQQVEEMLTNGEFEKAYEQEREKLRAEVGEPWDYINAQFQMEMNRLKGNNMRTIEGTVEPPQLPPEK